MSESQNYPDIVFRDDVTVELVKSSANDADVNPKIAIAKVKIFVFMILCFF